MISTLIIAAAALVVAIVITLARFDLLKFLGYAAVVDVLFTILMFNMFAGTFSGIVAAAFAGLFMTSILHVLRGSLGYKKLRRKGMKLVWVYYDGVLKQRMMGAFA